MIPSIVFLPFCLMYSLQNIIPSQSFYLVVSVLSIQRISSTSIFVSREFPPKFLLSPKTLSYLFSHQNIPSSEYPSGVFFSNEKISYTEHIPFNFFLLQLSPPFSVISLLEYFLIQPIPINIYPSLVVFSCSEYFPYKDIFQKRFHLKDLFLGGLYSP